MCLENRAMKHVRNNAALAKQQPVAGAVTPVVASVEPAVVTPVAAVTPTDDDDVDDLLGLG